jgi:hypothetical protein
MDNIKSLFGSKCYDTDYKTTNIFWRFGTKIDNIYSIIEEIVGFNNFPSSF